MGEKKIDRQKTDEKSLRKLVFQLRMNEEEFNLLDMLSYVTDDTKADVLRKALMMYANEKRGLF